jgi:hypothetical protein
MVALLTLQLAPISFSNRPSRQQSAVLLDSQCLTYIHGSCASCPAHPYPPFYAMPNIAMKSLSKQRSVTYGQLPEGEAYETAERVGIPGRKSILSWKELASLVSIFSCAAGAITAVYSSHAAVALGQTNQLVVLGFCLAIMAMGTHRHAIFANISYDVHQGRATVQSLESLLRGDMLLRHTGYTTRSLLLVLTVLPLALSVGYKRAVGGHSSTDTPSFAKGGQFGMAYPPGYQRIGLGQAMASHQYLPFWLNPRTASTYGFALYVESNATAAVLDAPFANFFTEIQGHIGESVEDSVFVTAKVNATVSESRPFSDSELSDPGWEALEKSYGENWHNPTAYFDHPVLFASRQPSTNSSRTIISIWDPNLGQTERGQARQTFTSRREAYGTWKINSSSVTLESATLVPARDETRALLDQSIIEDNMIHISGFSSVVIEFDYIRYTRPTDVDTVPALTATMLWSRIVEGCGYGNPYSPTNWRDVNNYWKAQSEIQFRLQRVTLRRDTWLLVILLINPAIAIVSIAVKMFYFSSPVDEGVGLVSLLAAVDAKTLSVLDGAGLSGKLDRRVGMRFEIVDEHVVVRLDDEGSTNQIKSRQLYS